MAKTIHVNAVYYNGIETIKYADTTFKEEDILDAIKYYDEWVWCFKNSGWIITFDNRINDNLLNTAVNRTMNLRTSLIGRNEATPTGKICVVNLWFTDET